jgi:hypothetical protein
MTDQMEKLKKASEPLLKILNNEYHPNTTVIITPTSIKLVEDICFIPKIYDYIKD